MKKTTFLKVILLAFIFLQSFISYSQTLKAFTPRFDKDIKGDMLLIGNSILNRNEGPKSNDKKPNDPYNDSGLNSDFDMQFINIDNGATAGVFNSSSANLVVPNASAPAAPCYKILYAALYWGAVTKGTTPITNIKFKMPTGGYNDVVGTIIHDSGTNVIGTSYPYACYADVTSLVTGAGNPTPEGTYTVANVSSKVGSNRPANTSSGGTGLSAGWSLFIVYEDPKLAAKSITSFDGFSAISSTVNLDIPVTGFRTIPTGPVRAKFAFSALEGDQGISGDYLTINGSILSAVNNAGTTIRGTNNFFNSSVTYIDPANGKTEDFINRNPASTNTLGYDAGILEINNNGNAIIKNNDISAVIGLRSNQDVYFYYFNAISLEIIEPKIVLTKQVFSDATLTNNIGNANVTLGQELFYAIGFQNIGNDNAENFTIKDILPININFDPNNIIVPNGSGITYVYNAATRTIVFTIPSNLVEKNDPRYIIKFKVQVVPECNDLSDACSDKIQNQAFASYVGVTSDIKVDDQLSLSTFGECYLGTASPTNFLVGVENCIYTKDYQLCGASVVLTAANGYNSYSWSTSATGTPVIGTTQSITVSQTGTYYVNNIANAPCRSIKQVVTVSPSGTTVQNPVIPFADQVVQCPNNGKDLPKIFLCGANATRLINTGVTDAISIVWQKLNEASCTAIGTDDCANEKVDCTWDNIATGSSYTANTSGQFRVVFNYAGGCFNIFYFNVFKNLLNPTATSKDIICNTSGEIIVGGVPTSGYEFSLSASGPFQDSNVFSITTANTYTVYIRQKGIVSNPCLFSVPGIDILQRNFTVSEFVSQPLCNGDKGSIKLAANDVRAQYFYSISKSGSLVNAVGPIAASDHTFSNLSPGSYDYEVKTDDGCLKTGTIVLIEPDVLKATVNQTKALTCETGEITVYPIGGTAPYAYYVNGSTTAQYSAVVNTPTAGNYTIRVVDYNGCIANTSITIAAVPKPVYNPTGTNVNCYGDTTGVINFNVTNANGYTLAYSINNGTTYGSSAIISNLAAGTYNTILKYSLNGVDCLDTMKVITITQPSTALTASAGVSELAGCGPAGEGKIRITNPQGGTPTYEYSFDNQTTWITVNDAYKAPGTYTVYIKDANGCIYPMPNIIIEPEPVAPVIDVNTPVDFNCDGTATSTVTINNPGTASFTYNYYLDGTINPNTTNPNTFLNVPPGTHTVKVEYNLVSVPTYSNLLKEDFGYGDDTTSPGINTAFYCFERQVVATQCKGSTAINDGDYSVTANIVNPFSAWVQPGDHTTQTVPPTPKGRSLVVNIGDQIATSDILYQKVINDIIPNQPINFELYAMNLLKTGNTQVNADLRVALVNAAGVEISWFATGDIPKTQKWEVYPKTPVTLNPGANTTLRFIIRSNKRATSGNDVAIDDIKVFQLPKSCITTRSFTVVVPTGKAFTGSVTGFKNVTCNGLSNGEITISATNFDAVTGYQYSLDNGTTWNTTVLTTSPYTITNLAPNTYTVAIRPVGSTVTACTQKFPPVTIAQPDPIVVNATKTAATCITGATIDARTTTGGTPAYKFELINTLAPLTVTAFPPNGILTNVPPGSYLIKATDANGCNNPTDYGITIDAVPTISAAVDPSTAMCFDPSTGAQINVSITGGTGPFSYQTSLNGGTFSASSATFTTPTFTHTAAVTGNYIFRVTDSNGCFFDTAQQIINAKLTANAPVTTDLDCDVLPGSPDALITGTISGGTAPFTVLLTSGQTTGTLAGPVGNSATFTYTTGASGVYQFQITDAIGCITNTSATINAKVAVTGNAIVTNETCETLNNGSVTLQALTGVAPFTYNFNSLGFSNIVTYGSLSGSVGGTSYPYQIRDNKGCIFNGTATVFEPNPITLTASITTPYTCDGPATITASASNGNGGFTYVLTRGTTTVATNTTGLFPNLSVAGSYTVKVTDAKGCPLTSAPMLIEALTPPTAMMFTNTAVTCPANKTDITIDSVTGGSGAVEYRIIAPASAATAYQAGATFAGLDPGVTYRFEVRDAKNCTFAANYSVPVLPTLTASGVVVNNVICFGDSDGSVRYTVGGFGNLTPYFYTIDGGTAIPGTSPATGTTFDILAPGLAAGAHVIVVTNTNTSCTVSESVTVGAPSAALVITAPTISPITCNVTTASITINTSGGWGSNTYTVTGPSPATTVATQTTRTFNNLAAGNYTATVNDLNGCSRSINFTIASYTALVVTPTVTNACSVTGNTNEIVATATGGSGTYTYSINTGVAPTGLLLNTFNVAPGNYTITVRDAFGCIDTETVTVSEVLVVTAVRTKDISCSTPQEATIRVTISGGIAPFTYRVKTVPGTYSGGPNAVTGNPFIYTAPGNIGASYEFEITDANGCIRVTNIVNTNTPTPVAASTSITDLTCFQSGNGAVTINPTAGVAPFEYNFNGLGFSSISSYSSLAASPATGYPYVVRDSKGCLFNGNAIVNQPSEIIYTVTPVNMTCSFAIVAGSITVNTITNGNAPFNYTLRNLTTGEVLTHPDLAGASHTFPNLGFGNYEVIVSDNTGCSKTTTGIQVLAPPEDLDINLFTTADCTNGATIIVSINPTVVPPTPNYEFGIYDLAAFPYSSVFLAPDGATSPDNMRRTFTNLTPGVVYTFVVRDNLTGCYYFETAAGAVPPVTTLTSDPIVANNVTCTGTATGSVTFTLDNYNATTVNYEIFRNQTNVSTGITGSVVTAAPSTITTPAGLTPGQYYITFTEVGGTNNGCTSASAVFTITESPVLLDLNVTATKNDNCNVNAGEIVAFANGGTAPYSFILNTSSTAPAANDPLWDSPSTFNVQSGSYYVWVKDNNGCIIGDPVNVLLDPSPVIDLTVLDVCAVEGAFAVDVTLTSPGVGPYKISVNGGDYEDVISFPYPVSGLSSGPQTIVVIDANGCTSNSATVTLTKKLSVIADRTKELDCTTSPDGLITVTVSDGLFTPLDLTPDFRYEVAINGGSYGTPVNFANDVRSFTYTVTTAGTYQFRITDLNNCTVESTIVDVAAIVFPTATPTVTPPTCAGATNATLIINASLGVLPYEYSIDGGTNWQDSNEFTGLGAGLINYIVRDNKECIFNGSENIINPTPVIASVDSVSAFTCSSTNTPNVTVVTVSAAGGAGNYSFSADGINYFPSNSLPVDNRYAFNVIDIGVAQNLTFYAKDANDCIDDIIVPIAAFPKLVSASASLVTKADCTTPTPTEIINVSITGGATPTNFSYQVAIDGGAYGALVPITAGTTSFNYNATSIGSFYEFKITDNTTGCSIISNAYTVPVFNTMTVTASAAANVDCATNATGAIEINIGNYTGPYNYTIWLGGVPTAFTGSGNTSTNPFVLPHGLVAGNNYTVVVAQTTYPSCSVTSNPVAITEPVALDLTNLIVNVKNQNCNTTGAVLTVDDATIAGGKRDYTYAFVLNGTGALPPAGDFKPSNTATFTTTQIAPLSDTVEVWVKDANGCTDMVTVNISVDPEPTVTATVASQCASATGYTIDAVGTGVGSLEYSLDGISFGTSDSFNVSSPRDYYVWVKDANDCIVKTAVPVTIFEPLQLQADITTLSTCLNADGLVTLTASGGFIPANYEYSIDGITYGSSNVFGSLAASATPYTFYVRNMASVPVCVKSVDVIMLLPNTAIAFVLDPTPVTCNGGSDGTITVNMDTSTLTVNNNPQYTFTLTGTSITGATVNLGPQPSPLFSGLAASDTNGYTVTVTSGRGCDDTKTVIVDEPDPIVVPTIVPVQFGCITDNTGNLAIITVTGVSGGSGTYKYEFIKEGAPDTQVQFGDSNVYTEGDLKGGSYIVNVYDDKGCVGTTTTAIIIDPYVQLDKVNVTVTRPITCAPKTEDITVSATTIGTGTTNLEYTLVDVIYDPITGVPTTGSIYPAVPNNNGIFTNLPVGNYLITVKNLDTNCEIQGVHYVNEPNTFDLTIDTVVDVTCFSGTNGSVNVTFVDRLITTNPVNGDDAGAFTYTLEDAFGNALPGGTSANAGPITISGLAAGTYTITATLSQSPSCPVIKNFTITGPTAALDITETHTEITCVSGNNDGTIAVTATGGWPGAYEFELVGPTPAQNIAYSAQTEFTGLTAGTYTINVRDSKGCVDFITVTLADPAPIVFTATPSTTLVSCFGDTSATITAGLPIGGSGNYLYSLVTTYTNGTVTTDGPQVSNTFTNLGAGSYQVQVSDSWTCSALSAAIVITEPAKVTASLALATAISCDVDATLTLTASGGTAPYEYSTTSNFGTVIGMTGYTATFSVPVGTYNYYIRDINGCESFISNDITIDKVPDLVIDVNIQNAVINCKGDDSGVIVATAQGGLGNYVYTLLDGAGNALSFTSVQTSPGNFTNLPAGSYLVNVVSMDCEARTVVPVVITEPDFPLTESNAVTNITCAGEGDGKIVITASGGTGIIKYAISPDLNQFFESNVFDNLKPGTYDYIVQDENGCFIYTTGVIISEPNSIFVTTIPGTEMPEVCAGDADGAFSINVTGGNAPYSVSLDDVNGTYTAGTLVQTQFDFTGLSGSEHVVYVRDANNCTTEHTVILGEAVILNPQATLNYDCVNNSASNSVTVTVDASNLPADLDYALDGSTVFQASNVFTNVTPGQHTIDVRHSNGCIKQVVFDVIQVDPLTLTLADGGLNEIVATATGGGGNYQYTLDGESYGNQSNFIIYKSGNYTVTVTDINGCTATATRYFEFIDIKIPNVFTPNGDGNNDTWAPTNTINYKDLVFYVYDRYGRKLGSYRESQFWDGKYNGNELPSGDYWYVIKIRDVKDAREFVGHFTLYR